MFFSRTTKGELVLLASRRSKRGRFGLLVKSPGSACSWDGRFSCSESWFKLHGGPHFIAASREMGFWDDLQYYQFREAWCRSADCACPVYLTVAGFACGQLASMFIRSGILAAFVGLTLAGVVYEWSKLVQMMEISWLWTLLPIPVVLLCATWLCAPDWILERNNWRGWLRIGVALLVPLTAILIAVPLYRIYQIPDAEAWFGFSAEKHFAPIEPTDAAKETADIYRRAADAMEWMDWEEWGSIELCVGKIGLTRTSGAGFISSGQPTPGLLIVRCA